MKYMYTYFCKPTIICDDYISRQEIFTTKRPSRISRIFLARIFQIKVGLQDLASFKYGNKMHLKLIKIDIMVYW